MEEEHNRLWVRSYSNAFKIHIFGSTAMDLIVDFLVLFFGSWIMMYGLGQLPLIEKIYHWTWKAGWWFIPYLVIPISISLVFIIKIRRSREGISVLRWIFYRLTFDKRKYTPFSEKPTIWKKIKNWIQREEELY